ncbi:MAG: Cj0069 family protein [Alphaproteobacteria bacterium]|nr:Cj0069 family protein [Alphaproteobacteria bacterium]
MDEHTTSAKHKPRIAVLWRGDPANPDAPAPHEAKLKPIIGAVAAAGFEPHGVVWFDERAGEIEAQLARMAGVLVWINPIANGHGRAIVDAALRRVAAQGVWVSTHPDVTALIGTKEVLYTTRELGWGANTDRYENEGAFDTRFWKHLANGPRVLKPLRGNDGRRVMKVTADGAGLLVQHASDDRIERMDRHRLTAHVRDALLEGALIDQPFNANAAAGMVRCYLAQAHVVGFAEQHPRQEGRDAFAMNGAKTMHRPDAQAFADLRDAMETDWVPGLQRILSLETARLPALWDADFLYRIPGDTGSRFVLCEINVSCVSPFPEAAPTAVAEAVTRCILPGTAGF